MTSLNSSTSLRVGGNRLTIVDSLDTLENDAKTPNHRGLACTHAGSVLTVDISPTA